MAARDLLRGALRCGAARCGAATVAAAPLGARARRFGGWRLDVCACRWKVPRAPALIGSVRLWRGRGRASGVGRRRQSATAAGTTPDGALRPAVDAETREGWLNGLDVARRLDRLGFGSHPPRRSFSGMRASRFRPLRAVTVPRPQSAPVRELVEPAQLHRAFAAAASRRNRRAGAQPSLERVGRGPAQGAEPRAGEEPRPARLRRGAAATAARSRGIGAVAAALSARAGRRSHLRALPREPESVCCSCFRVRGGGPRRAGVRLCPRSSRPRRAGRREIVRGAGHPRCRLGGPRALLPPLAADMQRRTDTRSCSAVNASRASHRPHLEPLARRGAPSLPSPPCAPEGTQQLAGIGRRAADEDEIGSFLGRPCLRRVAIADDRDRPTLGGESALDPLDVRTVLLDDEDQGHGADSKAGEMVPFCSTRDRLRQCKRFTARDVRPRASHCARGARQ